VCLAVAFLNGAAMTAKVDEAGAAMNQNQLHLLYAVFVLV
jgi:hypothetical protein